ncbi:response regulator transcription factor [Paenibacillus sp. CMAA1364]
MYKVFIVDDEPFIIEGLYDIIDWAELGMEIIGHAENGLDALKALQTTPADILITDISMPLMNGLDLIRSVQEYLPQLKVIVLSGYDEFSYVKEGLTLGIENYLLKPINIEEFEATLNLIVEKLYNSNETHGVNEHSMMILRDHVINRWMRKQISPLEFKERVDMLGIAVHTQHVLVSLLRLEHSNDEVFQSILSALNGYDNIIAFRDMDGDIGLVFSFDDLDQGKIDVEVTHTELISLLSDHYAIHLASGSIEKTEQGAHDSYTNAKKVQEYFMIFPNRDMISYEDIKDRESNSERHLHMNWNEYVKLMMGKNKEELIQLVEEDFKTIQQIEGISPSYVQDVAMEWIIRFKMQLEEIQHTDLSDMYQKYLDQIRYVSSIEELIDIMKDVVTVTVDSLTHDMKSPIVSQVLKYIDESYDKDLSLKTLGELYNIHPVYLGHLFNKEVGESFAEYINRYRIEKAKDLLRSTQMKVQEISRTVGYWETGYFYKQFKKYVGISPKEYKGL